MFGMVKGESSDTPSGRRGRSGPDLHALEGRVDRLEGDLDAVRAGDPLSAPPLTRNALISRWLIVGGIVLIVAAIAVAIF